MVNPNNNSREDYEALVRQILNLAEGIYREVKLSIPPEWLDSDMTVAQLRVMLVLYADGPSRMSSIASTIGIAISSATGIVDNLVKKELVTRSDDPKDRRLVICALSHQGMETINAMWALGQSQMEELLQGLSLEELKKAAEVAGFLLSNVKSKTKG
jgi:DNA-binding MarR family transcriptional regulator